MRLNFVIQIPTFVKPPDFCSGAIGWILFPFLVLSGSPGFWRAWVTDDPMTQASDKKYLNDITVHFISGELARFGSLVVDCPTQLTLIFIILIFVFVS